MSMRAYLSFGGGVNSVALYLLLLEQGKQPGDAENGFEAVFVDHGGDWPETYEYLEFFRSKYPVTVIHPCVEGETTLQGYIHKHNLVPSFMNRWCTDKFKRRVVNKYVAAPCWMLLGIDDGESHRARMSSAKGIEARWPLIEAELDRQGCIDLIKRHGISVPMKSGCFFCPNQSPLQFKALRRKHPCLFAEALEMERANMVARAARGKRPLTLHASGKTLETIVNEHQATLATEFDYPPCECGL